MGAFSTGQDRGQSQGRSLSFSTCLSPTKPVSCHQTPELHEDDNGRAIDPMHSITQSYHPGFDPALHPSQDVPNRRGLSRDQERELAALIANGDQAARNRMVLANLGLIVTIACRFQGRGLLLDDLIGEGNLGLIRAAEKHDPRFGTRFSTFACPLIKQAIKHALMTTTATIGVPLPMEKSLIKWRKAERMLHQELKRKPDFEES